MFFSPFSLMLAPPGALADKIVELLALGGMGSLDVRLQVEERREVGADGDLLRPALEAKVLGHPLAEIRLNEFEKGYYSTCDQGSSRTG